MRIEVKYKNHRGEIRVRDITPKALYFGTSPYHSGEQWFIRAFDHEKNKDRDFSLWGFCVDVDGRPIL